MPETVLVTGATGFIGRPLVRALQNLGCPVQALSSRDGDIAVPPLGSVADVGHIYHLAARSFVPDSWNDPHGYYRTNVLGTATVLEHCRRSGASLTFLSSYVYGPPMRLPIDEDHPVRASNPYSHSKILGEDLVRYYAERFGVRAVIIRPFNIYGPGQAHSFLIPMILQQLSAPEAEIIEVADDRPKRDFLYVDDLIDLLLRVPGLNDRVYNAGSGSSTSVAGIVEALNLLLRKPRRLACRGQERAVEVMDVVADISKVRQELGWEPATSLSDGLRRTMEACGLGAEL